MKSNRDAVAAIGVTLLVASCSITPQEYCTEQQRLVCELVVECGGSIESLDECFGHIHFAHNCETVTAEQLCVGGSFSGSRAVHCLREIESMTCGNNDDKGDCRPCLVGYGR